MYQWYEVKLLREYTQDYSSLLDPNDDNDGMPLLLYKVEAYLCIVPSSHIEGAEAAALTLIYICTNSLWGQITTPYKLISIKHIDSSYKINHRISHGRYSTNNDNYYIVLSARPDDIC